MISISQFKQGILSYIENELLTLLPQWKRFAAATYIALAADNLDEKLNELRTKPMIEVLGLFDESGNIDINRLRKVLSSQMNQQKELVLPIPVLGDLTLTAHDLDKLMQYIEGGKG